MQSISRRMNAWQRLAFVLTALWLIIGTHHFWIAQVDANYAMAAASERVCEGPDMTGDSVDKIPACTANYTRQMERYGAERWNLLAATFAGITVLTALFWAAVWIAARVIRWILAGRNI